MSRPAYVYRLDVVWPEGTPRVGCDLSEPYSTCESCYTLDRTGGWPRWRRYLSAVNAGRRAARLRHLGAQVTVQRSRPIEFPEPLTPVDTGAVDDDDD